MGQVALALLNLAGICSFHLQKFIFLIDELQCFFVELQIDDTALIIDWHGGVVEDALGHIVNINAVAEDFDGVAVFQCHWGTREADERGIRQGVVYQSGGTDTHFTRHRINFLFEAVLTAMGFIAHHDDIAAGGQGRIVFLELLHGGEDDAVGRAAFKQLAQMFPCGGLHRLLTQEVLALGELTIKLVVEVIAVGDDHDGRL